MPENITRDVPKGREETTPSPEVAVELRQRSVERGFASASGPAPQSYGAKMREAVIDEARAQRPTFDEAYRRGLDASIRNMGERVSHDMPERDNVAVELSGHTVQVTRTATGVEFKVDDQPQTSDHSRQFFENNLPQIEDAIRRRLEAEKEKQREREEQMKRDADAQKRDKDEEARAANSYAGADYAAVEQERAAREEAAKEQAMTKKDEREAVEAAQYER